MASFQQLFYCKNCKKNVPINEKGQCSICNSTSLNKSWSVRFRYVQEDGKEVQKRLSGYSTRREANDAYVKFTATAKKYVKTDKETNQLKFNDLYVEYKNFYVTRVKPSSYYDFCSKSDIHIVPYFANFIVKKIKPKDILDWQQTISKYSYKYKMNLRSYLSSILSFASKYYDIPNQIKNVDGFRRTDPVKEMQIWTPEEFNHFIDNIDSICYKAFFCALYLTGARKGELLATTWEDWDLTNKILNINKTLTKKVYNEKYIITSPKTHSSIRKISLPDKLVNMMTKLKDYFIKNDLSGFVFFGKSPLADSSIGKVLNNTCKKINLKPIRIHDFRHSHASYLLGNGISVVAVSKRLGHSNVKQTLETYAHLVPQEMDNIIKKLNEI